MQLDRDIAPGPDGKPAVRRWAPLSGAAPRQLVVLCHGYGSGPGQLGRFLPEWQRAAPEAVFVAPRGPEARAPRLRDQLLGRRPPGLGYQWFGLGRTATVTQQVGVRQAARFLNAFIDAEQAALDLADAPYALIGFSQGAIVALYTGLRRARGPACIVCHSAELLAPETLAAELRSRPGVTLVLAEEDDVVPASRGLEAAAALRAAGLPVTTHYLEGAGHDSLKGLEERTRARVAPFASDALKEAFGP